MITEEREEISCTEAVEEESEQIAKDGDPISVANLLEAITVLTQPESKNKITLACAEDEFFFSSLRMLAAFVRMIVSDKYMGASDEIILRSDGLLFTVEVKKGRAFPECEDLIKCANLAGFSAEDGRWEIRFSATSASGLWIGLYAKTENKLLCLLKSNAF